MISTDVWADELTVLMPGLTQLAAQQALGATIREFCTVSGAWTRELPQIEIVSGQAWYSLNPLTDANVLYIMAIGYANEDDAPNGNVTKFLSPLQSPHHHTRVAQPGETPWGYSGDAEVPGRFRLIPTVNTDRTTYVIPFVALGPLIPFDNQAPDHFQQVHFDAILDGAASKLMGQQDKSYSNIVMARYYGHRFRAAMAVARDMARKQFTSADTDFRFPSWTGRPMSGGY